MAVKDWTYKYLYRPMHITAYDSGNAVAYIDLVNRIVLDTDVQRSQRRRLHDISCPRMRANNGVENKDPRPAKIRPLPCRKKVRNCMKDNQLMM